MSKPEILIGTSGYDTTQVLLKKMVSLLNQGKKVTYLTSDTPEMIKLNFYDLLLESKPEMKEEFLLNKKYVTIPNSEGYSFIKENFEDKFNIRQISMMSTIDLMYELENSLEDHVIIDTLNRVSSCRGYPTRESWLETFITCAAEIENLEITASVYR